ncbi:response regulator transcription factor [Vibrio sp. SM6]|uniref:Phosphate regulon transcriptional regulatory protein PhoB n=1 Tax=Vibrio agarilyticus TaxID=2726741 RepID=A0A7X8TN38_9VIBR|nr:response regulator transcription factor [Vibrio agarilyticus]NLS11796.1 response regulator transcription factor [Vibrio agarilyticus]
MDTLPTGKTILLVEDDNDLAALIELHLKILNHHVVRGQSCADATTLAAQHKIDLWVLDRGLPDGDGLSLCQMLRKNDDWTPVLMLTARDSELERVDGLEAGVDDYITKPFSVLEFQARVRNVLRRHQHREGPSNNELNGALETPLQFGALTISPQQHDVAIDRESISLTATEFSLLHFLAQRPGRVYSKTELLEHVWQTPYEGYQHTVCSTINRLRSKLRQRGQNCIQTVWGVGYKFDPLTTRH